MMKCSNIGKINAVIGLTFLLSALFTLTGFPFVSNAAVYNADANQNWSDFSPLPKSGDDINIRNDAILTVDIDSAVCAVIVIAKAAGPRKGDGTLIFNAGSQVTVSGPVKVGEFGFTGTIDMTSGGKLICHLFQTDSGSTAILIEGSGIIEVNTDNTLLPDFITYNNLIIDSATTTLSVNTIVTGDLIINNGAALYDNGFNLTFSGNVIINGNINSSGTFTLDGAVTTIDGTGTIDISNVWTFTGNKTILSTANLTFTGNYPIDIISGITTVNGTITCDSIRVYNDPAADTKLRIDNGSLTVNGGALASATTVGAGKKAIIELINTSTMTVNGDLEILGNSDDAKCDVKNNSQLIVNGNIKLTDTGGKKAELKGVNSAVISVNGDIIYNATDKDRAKIRLVNNAVLNIIGNFDRSAAGNYGELDCFVTTVVNFNGTSPQILSLIMYGGKDTTKKWRYGEVQINNMAGVTLDAGVSQDDQINTIQDDIRIQTGILYSGEYSIELATTKIFEIANNTTYYTTTTDAMGGMLLKGKHKISATGTVNFAATSPQNVPQPMNPLNAWDYGHLIISNTAVKSLTGNIDVNGNLTISGSAQFDVDAANNYSINLAGNWINTSSNSDPFLEREGIIIFDGSTAQTINPGSANDETFYDITIDKSNIVSQKAYSPTSNFNTFYGVYDLSYINDGNLTDGTIWGPETPSPYELTMTFASPVFIDSIRIRAGQYNGNYHIPAEMKLYRGTSSGMLLATIAPTYTMDGYGFSNTQSDTMYTWLITPNASGYSSVREIECWSANYPNDVTLTANTDVTVTNNLTLTSGDIVLDNNILIINAAATVSGGSATSYIQADSTGSMRKLWTAAGAFTYPVGDTANYSPYTLTFNSASFGAGAYVDVRVVDAKEPNHSEADHITRYWVVTPNGITSPNYDVSYIYVDADVVGTESNMFAHKWAASWTDYDAVNTATNTLTGSAITAFSNFTGKKKGAPLPITLLSFNAELNGDKVDLNWATASETNNDYFTVQTSTDGVDFENVTYVTGAGNSNRILHYAAVDDVPFYGLSYYRLKQTDYDGQFSYSDVVAVNYLIDDDNIAVYPIPTNRKFFVVVKGNKGDEVLVIVRDLLGKEHYSKAIILHDNGYTLAVDLSNKLSAGVYLVTASSQNKLYRKKIVIQ